MNNIKRLLSWINMIWDEFTMSSLSFIFVMPMIIGIIMIFLVQIGDIRWENNIDNPINTKYVLEVAFNLDIPTDQVTQRQFNKHYK